MPATNLFHFHQVQQETLVVDELLQLSQLFQVHYPLVSDFLPHPHHTHTSLTNEKFLFNETHLFALWNLDGFIPQCQRVCTYVTHYQDNPEPTNALNVQVQSKQKCFSQVPQKASQSYGNIWKTVACRHTNNGKNPAAKYKRAVLVPC